MDKEQALKNYGRLNLNYLDNEPPFTPQTDTGYVYKEPISYSIPVDAQFNSSFFPVGTAAPLKKKREEATFVKGAGGPNEVHVHVDSRVDLRMIPGVLTRLQAKEQMLTELEENEQAAKAMMEINERAVKDVEHYM